MDYRVDIRVDETMLKVSATARGFTVCPNTLGSLITSLTTISTTIGAKVGGH
jgi:hypothetical protein